MIQSKGESEQEDWPPVSGAIAQCPPEILPATRNTDTLLALSPMASVGFSFVGDY